MEIGKTIKALRAQKRVTQEQTAAHPGVSCQAVSKWETGASLPDVTLLPAIAAWFGVTIDELFQMPAEARFEQVENMLDREGHIAPEAFSQAAAFLSQTTVDDPKSVRAWTDLAYLYNHRAQYDHYLAAEYAKRALELAPEENPGWVAYLEAMGGVYGDEGYDNHFEVIEYFKRFVEKNPDNYRGYYALIENLLADGRYDEAEPLSAPCRRSRTTTRPSPIWATWPWAVATGTRRCGGGTRRWKKAPTPGRPGAAETDRIKDEIARLQKPAEKDA